MRDLPEKSSDRNDGVITYTTRKMYKTPATTPPPSKKNYFNRKIYY